MGLTKSDILLDLVLRLETSDGLTSEQIQKRYAIKDYVVKKYILELQNSAHRLCSRRIPISGPEVFYIDKNKDHKDRDRVAMRQENIAVFVSEVLRDYCLVEMKPRKSGDTKHGRLMRSAVSLLRACGSC